MAIRIALAGDTMLGRKVAVEIATAGPSVLFSPGVRQCFASADLGLVNLECCVSARGRPWGGWAKAFHFRAPPEAAGALASLGVDCVTLANNHALDYGYDALADTLSHLAHAGIAAAGAGMDEERARAPALLVVGGVRVAVLGVTDHPADFAAGPHQPGVAYADLARGVPPWLTRQTTDLAAGNDVVVVMPHWGPNMTDQPQAYIRSAAHALVEAGATLVAGSSAHVFHGAAGRVLYDMGDFIDDYVTDPDLRNDRGLLFVATLEGRHLQQIEAVPLKLGYAHTYLAEGADRDWIEARFTSACAAMNTPVHTTSGRLVITPA